MNSTDLIILLCSRWLILLACQGELLLVDYDYHHLVLSLGKTAFFRQFCSLFFRFCPFWLKELVFIKNYFTLRNTMQQSTSLWFVAFQCIGCLHACKLLVSIANPKTVCSEIPISLCTCLELSELAIFFITWGPSIFCLATRSCVVAEWLERPTGICEVIGFDFLPKIMIRFFLSLKLMTNEHFISSLYIGRVR